MPKPKQPQVAESLAEMREAAGFATVEAVGQNPDGMDFRTVAKAERGDIGITMRTLRRLATLYGRPFHAVAAAYLDAVKQKGAA